MVLRLRTKVFLALAVGAGVGYLLLPIIVEQRIRSRLVERGFRDAHLDVASVGLSHMQLRNVHLAEGVDLGTIGLDRGVSLMWSDVHDVSIRHANITDVALARIASLMRSNNSGAMPFEHARVDDSIVNVQGTPTQVAGSAAARGDTLELSVSIRDPSQDGWSAEARGRLVLGKHVSLEDGHVSATIPHGSLGSASFDDVSVVADVAGPLTALVATGTVHAVRADVGPYMLAALSVPFTVAGEHVSVSAKASLLGGELRLEPATVRDRSLDLVLRARGLELARLLAPTKRVTGSGVIDGELALHVDSKGWSLLHGELHARSSGALVVRDAKWRKLVATPGSQLAVQTRVINALTDFEYSALTAELAPPGSEKDVRVSLRGRGRTNHQELDIALRARGVRDIAAHLPGAAP